MSIATLPRGTITVDERLQKRPTDEKTVKRYETEMLAGDEFPPIQVVYDGDADTTWVWNGFHRLAAIDQLPDHAHVKAEVTIGTWELAEDLAYGANAHTGLRLTDQQKWDIIVGAIQNPRYEGFTSVQIAEKCRVSAKTVKKVEAALAEAQRIATKRERKGEAPGPVTVERTDGRTKEGKAKAKPQKRIVAPPEAMVLSEVSGEMVTPLEAATEKLELLRTMNDDLRTELAIAATDATPAQKLLLVEENTRLRATVKGLEQEAKSLRGLRQADVDEKTELKRQLNMLERKVKRLQAAAEQTA